VKAVRSVALALFVGLLALAAAGCGGNGDDEASAADEWVESFCGAALDWENEMERIGEDIGDISDLSSDRIRELGEEADAATQDFVDEVRELGGPDTASGDAIEQETQELSDTVDAEREEIRTAVEDVEGIVDVGDAVATVTTSLGQMLDQVSDVLETIGSSEADDELRTAYEASETCDELRAD
jgi:hypothetical protein